jgi:hypothetical protein
MIVRADGGVVAPLVGTKRVAATEAQMTLPFCKVRPAVGVFGLVSSSTVMAPPRIGIFRIECTSCE